MPVNFAAFSGKSHVGFKGKTNEDYILLNDNSFGDEFLFACVADGSGSKDSMFRPASIVSNEVAEMLARFYEKDPELLRKYSRIILEESFRSANNTLIGFKLGNEEERYGFATTLTACLLNKKGHLTIAHAGNTRLYLIRDSEVKQLTKDHTEGQKLVDEGKLDDSSYYTAIERLSLYNGLGISPQPQVDTYKVKLKKNDVIILTSDGIHYSYKPEAFFEILMQTETVDDAVTRMIDTALEIKNYPDNISAIIIWYLGDPDEEEKKNA